MATENRALFDQLLIFSISKPNEDARYSECAYSQQMRFILDRRS